MAPRRADALSDEAAKWWLRDVLQAQNERSLLHEYKILECCRALEWPAIGSKSGPTAQQWRSLVWSNLAWLPEMFLIQMAL